MPDTAQAPTPTPAPDLGDNAPLALRRGRVIFRARRPAALVIPFALLTEAVGLFFVLDGVPIGPFVMAAPVVALLFTAVLFRPTLELTREGLVQRQYPFASLTRWEAIDHFGIARAGNRVILGYKLVDGLPPPRRQPAANLLRTAGSPYDGGYFADSIVGRPEDVLATVERYHANLTLRASLPPRRTS